MKTRRTPWLSLTGTMVLMLLVGGAASAADDQSADSVGAPPGGGLTDLLKLVGSPTFPSLSGLIQPEKMGILTDNPCHLHDNEAELGLLSDNVINVLSGNRIFSDITVTVNIQVGQQDDKAGELRARHPDRKPKAQGARKRKASRHAKGR